MKILGFENVQFNFNDGKTVKGVYVYLSDNAVNPQKVTGVRTERIFLSESKAAECNFIPKLGDNVQVNYNRFGKVQSIVTMRQNT